MALRKIITLATGIAMASTFAFASAASALTVSCVGVPTSSNITWTASSQNGVAPVAFLWSNGSTSSSQTIAVAPGTFSLNIQGTDASSTVATSTCSATVLAPLPAVPTVTSFIASPSTITAGQSAVLSWILANASSTSINNGVGTISSTSISVTPSVTTTYTLSASNPGGTTTASATITVNPVTPPITPPTGTTTVSQIQALLAQIAALKAQILQLLQQNQGGGIGGTGTTTSATTTPTTCFAFDRDLRRGRDGDDVRQMQLMLASDPSILPGDSVTGFFGERTEKALKKFQRKFGIGSSGFFGPLSRKFFHEQCQDTDHDGVLNISDNDDDNDGIPDTTDPHPLIPESKFSTSTRDWGHDSERDQNEGGSGKHGGKGGRDD